MLSAPAADAKSLPQRYAERWSKAARKSSSSSAAGDPLAPRQVSPGDLDQAAATLQEAASRLRPNASRLVAWVNFQTVMCSRSCVKAAAPAAAADIGVSERTIWNLVTELQGEWLAKTRGNGSAKVWQLADQCEACRGPVQSTNAETGVTSANQCKKPVQNCTGSSRARVFETDFLLEGKSSSSEQTALFVESAPKTDEDEATPKAERPMAALAAPDHAAVEVRYAQDQLRRSRNLGNTGTSTKEPHFQQAAAIRSLFQSREHFRTWLDGFDRHGKVGCIRAAGIAGYNFYLTDAKRYLEREAQAIREPSRKPTSSERDLANLFAQEKMSAAAAKG